MISKVVIIGLVLLWPTFILAESSLSASGEAAKTGEDPAETKPAPASSVSSSGAPDTAPTADADQESVNAQPEEGQPEGVETETAPEDTPELTSAPLPELNESDTLYIRLTKGHQRFLKGDYPGARYIYESAKTMEPGAVETYLYLAYTLAKLAYYDDAHATMAAALAVLGDKGDSQLGRALFTYALIQEMQGPSPEAKQRWEAYLQHAETQGGVGTFAATAEARLVALEKVQKLDEQYQVVRERIAKNSQ